MAADIINPIFKATINEKVLLMITRIGVIVIGIISLFIALKLKGIITSLLLGYTVYTSGLVIPVLLGFYAKSLKLNTSGVIAAVVGGGGMGLLLKLSGYNNLALLTFPVSAILLFSGSYLSRLIEGAKTAETVET